MQFLRSTLLLLITLFISGVAFAAPTEQDIRKHLPGEWRVNSTIDTVSAVGTSTFRPDGTVLYNVKLTGPGIAIHMVVTATWSVIGSQLTTKVVESSVPDMLPVGMVETDTVVAISDTEFTYVDNEGTQWTETRPSTARL